MFSLYYAFCFSKKIVVKRIRPESFEKALSKNLEKVLEPKEEKKEEG